MSADNRPLSPHLQVYKPQLTSVMSVLHRLTGLALAVGTLLLVYWLAAAAGGPESYAAAQAFIASPVGLILLFGWTLAFFYHLCNGIRHLFWDAGYGFELPTVYKSGWAVLVAVLVLTLLSWAIGLAVM